jgi:hypothetical protein
VPAGELAPPSILAQIVADQIDSAAAHEKSDDREVPPSAPGESVRRLRLWRLEGKPAKLMVAEVSKDAKLKDLSVWYFKDGQVVFARSPFDRYAFSNGALAEWTDQRGVVASADRGSMRKREQELKDEADRWLKEYGS